MPLYNLATRRLEDTYPYVTQVSKSSVNPDKWSFADGLGNPVYWFDGTASWANGTNFAVSASWSGYAVTAGYAVSAGWADTAGFANHVRAAGIEWDIQLNSASATDGVLGVAELGRGYYNWDVGAWTFGNRNTGSAGELVGSWSFSTNYGNIGLGDYSIVHGYKNIAADSADSAEGYKSSTLNNTVISLNLHFTYVNGGFDIICLQPGDFTTNLTDLNLNSGDVRTWFYNSVDDTIYEIFITSISYDPVTNFTSITISNNIATSDISGNGFIYYQSFNSIITGEPLANHAEGIETIAAGYGSHAEGKYTWANSVGSHAEGLNTISSNSGSHAEGRNTVASGDSAHSEGSDTIASGSSAHAEGYNTLAQGRNSHAEGFYTTALGADSHAGGRETVAYECGSFAIGIGTVASGAYQSVVGRYNLDDNTEDYFVVGDGIDSLNKSNAFGVNATRMYASNSIYLPDLQQVAYPHVLVYDTVSKIVQYDALNTITAATASHSLTTKAAGIEWDIQLNSSSATDGILGVAELGRGYYNWNVGGWSFGNRNTGSSGELVGSWSFSTNYGNVALGDYSIAHGYKNIAADSTDSVEGYKTTTVNNTIIGLNLHFTHVGGSNVFTCLQPGDFTTELTALGFGDPNVRTWFYNSIDDTIYEIFITTVSYNNVTNFTSINSTNLPASSDLSGNGFIYYQSFNSTVIGEPLANHAEGVETISAGQGSHAEGKYTWAYGIGSHAEGLNTISSYSGSHAEGRNTEAKGDASHAEGSDTIASGSSAHAEGYATLAQGEFSHAEGFYTIASGNASHAGGRETQALGYGSKAAGYQTIASGAYSHAEGYRTVTTGSYSHAEGWQTITVGERSHAEGYRSVASGSYSHAEGFVTYAYGNGAHSEGTDTVAFGAKSHAEGENTFTYTNYSHTEGGNTGTGLAAYEASWDFSLQQFTVFGLDVTTIFPIGTVLFILDSFASQIYYNSGVGYLYGAVTVTNVSLVGSDTIIDISGYTRSSGIYHISKVINPMTLPAAMPGATVFIGEYSHAEGSGSYAYGNHSHAEGCATIAAGNCSHAEGDSTIALGDTSHAEGSYTTASGFNAHSEGYGSFAYGNHSHAEGFVTLTRADASHAEGYYTFASASYSHAEGNRTTASGYYSHAEGSGSIAFGTSSHAEGYQTIASGSYSHAEGYQTTALGTYSHAEGSGSIADGSGSHAEGGNTYIHFTTDFGHAEGYYTYVRGDYSHAEGYYTSASYSIKGDPVAAHAEGIYTKALNQAAHAEGSGSIAFGAASHAEGIYTIASGSGQTVVGRYNLHNNTNDYFVIGDGTSDVARSNAFGVNDQRMYASNSIYFPDLTNVTQTNVVSIDTASGRLYWQETSSGGGVGTVGPGNQNYMAFFSGSTTQISSSTLKLEFDDTINGYDPKQYTIDLTTGYSSTGSLGSNLSVNNITNLDGTSIMIAPTYGAIIKEIEHPFQSAHIDFHIEMEDGLEGDTFNQNAIMFGTIMLAKSKYYSAEDGSDPDWPNPTTIGPFPSDPNTIGITAQRSDNFYSNRLGIDSALEGGYLTNAWFADDYGYRKANNAFQAIETYTHLPDQNLIPTTTIDLNGDPVNPLQQGITIRRNYYGVYFVYDIVGPFGSTGPWKLRVWCLNATGNDGGWNGQTDPGTIYVTTTTRLLTTYNASRY